MKKLVCTLLAAMLLFSCFSALAADTNYILEQVGTVLQSVADRNISPSTSAVRNPIIPGESPTTGWPWEGEYLPMIVQISNPSDTVKINGKNVKGAGIGNRAPWSGQYADIVFEGILARTGQTRISFLFSDSFADGEPLGGVGPVRSARIGHVYLREEWQSGFIYAGGPRKEDNNIKELFKQTGADEKGVLFDLTSGGFTDLKYRVKGVKAPDNYNADVIGMRDIIPDEYISLPRAFLFSDESQYVDGYEIAYTINLDWGHKDFISHFMYDETENLYLRYLGAGMDDSLWAPYMTYAAVDDRSEDSQEQMSFANVIIQRVAYDYVKNSSIMPDMQSIGKGNADIFIGGRYIAGYWVRNSVEDPTVFYDDQGNELVLTRGRTFIAHFPPESLLTFQGME